MTMKSQISRRAFLSTMAKSAAGLVVYFYIPNNALAVRQSPAAYGGEATTFTAPTYDANGSFKPNAYLEIDSLGDVTVQVFRSEMGQGVETALPMILAEELEADWSKIRIEQAPASRDFGDQVTGGSVSISNAYAPLRVAGAIARETLIAAAAQVWGVDTSSCTSKNGVVVHSSGKQLTYGELVAPASKLPLAAPKLKEPKDFHIIGTRIAQLDGPHFVDGSAVYGLDVRVPQMLFAAVARCPVFGGQVASFDATKAKASPGVRDVVQIDTGVAVVADTTWHAFNARDALEITWNNGTFAVENSETIRQRFTDLIAKQKAALKPTSGRVVEATYELPYLAHASLVAGSVSVQARLYGSQSPVGCRTWQASTVV